MLLNRQDLPTPASLERSGVIILVVEKSSPETAEETCEADPSGDPPGLMCFAPVDEQKNPGPGPVHQQRNDRGDEENCKAAANTLRKIRKAPGARRPRIRFPGMKHHGPMRRLKRSTALLQSSRNCLRGNRSWPTRRDLARIKSRAGSVVRTGLLSTTGMQAPRLPLAPVSQDALPFSKCRERPSRD